MSQQLPVWWINLSGAFFGISILLLIALLIATIFLIGTIRQVTKNIELLAIKVDEIGNKVSTLVTQVNTTSSSIGSKANNIVGSMELVTRALAGKAEMIGSALTVFMLARNFLANRKK